MPHSSPWIYIQSDAELQTFCNELRQQLVTQPWLALDTEFMREKTFFPQLCLLQVGTTSTTACIDPLAIPDLGPLLDIIYDSNVTKVFHAAHQDLEIFYHLQQSLPSPVFDTQIAAPLLGHPNQVGYANLVQLVLGITLSKGHARTDWSHRPLTEAQLSYAADDVRYLGQIYSKLRQQLADTGRLDWLKDDFARLSDPARYECEPELAWTRIRASKRLHGKSLQIIKTLAAWREKTARAKDLPRAWLLRDDTLCDLARVAPQSAQELKQIRGLSDKQARMIENELLPLINAALYQPREKTRPTPIPARPTAEQEALIEAMMAVVHLQAQDNHMHPSSLASRKDIEQWLLGPRADSPLMSGWRRGMIGEPLTDLLDGRRVLQVRDQALHFCDPS